MEGHQARSRRLTTISAETFLQVPRAALLVAPASSQTLTKGLGSGMGFFVLFFIHLCSQFLAQELIPNTK